MNIAQSNIVNTEIERISEYNSDSIDLDASKLNADLTLTMYEFVKSRRPDLACSQFVLSNILRVSLLYVDFYLLIYKRVQFVFEVN